MAKAKPRDRQVADARRRESDGDWIDHRYVVEPPDEPPAAGRLASRRIRRPLIDQLLLAIIDAHPTRRTSATTPGQKQRATREREKRFRDAYAALLGRRPKSGKNIDDRAILLDLAHVWHDRAKSHRKPSIRELTKRVVASHGGTETDEGRIRRKFAKEQAAYIFHARKDDGIGDDIERAQLGQLKSILKWCGLNMKIQPVRQR